MAFSKKLEAIETGHRRGNVRLNAMIGNSLLKDVSDVDVNKEDEETKVNFYWRSGAQYYDIVNIFEKVVSEAKVNTDFGVLLFQNSVRQLAKMNDEDLVLKLNKTFKQMRKIIDDSNQKGFYHRLVIAEEQYAPELEEYFGDIAFINEKISDENKRNDMGPFKLWKPQIKCARKVKNGNALVPRIVNNRWREWQQNGCPGYHIGEGRAMRKFAQFIRRYFQSKNYLEKIAYFSFLIN